MSGWEGVRRAMREDTEGKVGLEWSIWRLHARGGR